MSEMKTLREICERTGASRRAIQGYEKAGLVKPVGRNKYGYLLYDDCEENRIRKIRFLQKLGFTIREIRMMTQMEKEERLNQLKKKIQLMEEDISNKSALIEEAKKIIQKMEEEKL